jgi:DNA-binding SARP family transcriptional activator
VRTLGGLRQANDGDVRPLRRKPLALLSYVARRSPGAVTRTELATLFWGERGEERARQSLRQALLELKQVLGERIDVDADTVRVAADVVDLDIVAFERELSEGRVQEAVGRWAGDFFEGAEDIGGEGFRRWIENERASLHRQLGTAMERLIGDAELAGDWAGAAAWAQRWAAALPFEEAAHLRLIESLRMSGRSGDALKTHAAFVTRMRASLDLEPSAEFMRLGGGLADGAKEEMARRGRGAAAVLGPAMVGRGAVMTELLAASKSASAGDPVVVLLEGGGGYGLTRVCDELVSRIGADSTVFRAAGAGVPNDFATAAELFEGIQRAEGAAGAAPEALAEVARVVPSLTSEFKFLPTAVGDDAALRDGFAQTLAAIGEEQPALIVLDDAHAADEATQRLLSGLAPRLTGRVMVLLAADEAAREASPALSALRGGKGVRHIRLTALTPADVEAMLESMISLEPSERHALAGRLHQETNGVPLDVRELAFSLVDDRLVAPDGTGTWRVSPALGGRPLPMPAPVKDRVRAWLDQLSVPARSLAGAIAVLGGPVDGAVAATVAGLPADAGDAALGDLLSRRVLRELPSQPGWYEFQSPIAARAVSALLPATTREALHARSAEVLTERDLASTAERSLLAYHLARAPSAAPSKERGSKPPRSGRRRLAFIAIPAVAGVIVAALAMRGGKRFFASASAPTVPIVALGRIADYRQTTNPNLTKPLTDMLATNLGRVGRLRVVSAARMYELVSQAGDGDTSEGALVRAARLAGATELVDGALYARDDGGFRLDLRRVELGSGNIQKTYSIVGATLFELADSGTARVAADFGETTPLGSVADVTTKSLTAYRLYEQGLRAFYAFDYRAADPLFMAALKEDSTFAMAAYYAAINEGIGSQTMLQRFALAARLAAHTTDRERLTILAHYALLSSSPSLRAIAETLAVRYPDEIEGYYFTGLGFMQSGEFRRALPPLNKAIAMDSLKLGSAAARCLGCEAIRQLVMANQLADSVPAAEREARRWIRLQPRSPAPWHVLAELLSQMDRPSEAQAALDRASALDAGRREAERLLSRAVHYIYANDFEQADQILKVELESGSTFRAIEAAWFAAISFRMQGRLEEALEAARRNRALTLTQYPRGTLPRVGAPAEAQGEAQVLFEMGRYRAAAALFDSVSRWQMADASPSQFAHQRAWALAHSAGALAAAGDTAALPALIDTLEVVGPKSGLERDRKLPHYVRGLLLAARGQNEAAASELGRAIFSWNMGYTRTNIALARVLLRIGRAREAVTVLQPALRGSLESSNTYVSRTDIHEALGEAWAAVGGAAARDSSRAHYALVVRAWQRADPSFAERKARAEAGSKE